MMKNMNNYNTVNTKSGKAIVADTQTELENIAKQMSGDVVVLARRDGEDRYSELGMIALPYRFGAGADFTPDDMKYDTEAETYVISDISDYHQAIREENEFIHENPDAHPLIETDSMVIDEIGKLHDSDCMFLRFVDGHQFFDTFRKEQTRWHDADVNEYRLAVVTEF